MVNGALHSRFCSDDLGFEQLDALLQLLDRERIEVLPAQLGSQIVLATRKVFVGVHRRHSVGWRAFLVNADCDGPGHLLIRGYVAGA
jgi:hypothetical protein